MKTLYKYLPILFQSVVVVGAVLASASGEYWTALWMFAYVGAMIGWKSSIIATDSALALCRETLSEWKAAENDWKTIRERQLKAMADAITSKN